MKRKVTRLVSFGVLAVAGMTHVLFTRAADPAAYSSSPTIAPDSRGSVPVVNGNGTMASLKAQSALLKELAEEHVRKAADSAIRNQIDRVKWETELANELQEKNSRLAKIIDQVNSQRAASERAQPPAGTITAKAANGEGDEEVEYLSKVEERLSQVDQDLRLALEQTKAFTLDLATNNVPENLQRVSALEQENSRYVRGLQKEQFDLVLRKLEYRAIRTAVRK
jgi:hypothetical protein